MMNRTETCLNICTWNVGGITSDNINKSTDKLFIDHVKNHDLVLLTETHVGYDTHIDIENFVYYPICRQKSSNHRYFGGLGILVKKNIRRGIGLLHNTCTIHVLNISG